MFKMQIKSRFLHGKTAHSTIKNVMVIEVCISAPILLHDIPVINITHGPLRRTNRLTPEVIETLDE